MRSTANSAALEPLKPDELREARRARFRRIGAWEQMRRPGRLSALREVAPPRTPRARLGRLVMAPVASLGRLMGCSSG
jgi:hypothetical protein